MGLTRDGVAVALFTGGTVLVGALAARNLVLLVGVSLAALWVAEVALGSWNLRRVEVGRRLPPEVFAGQSCRGALRVGNRRRRGAALGLSVWEEGFEAAAFVARVPAGGEAELSLGWRFEDRGTARLEALRLASTWPFGWVRRERRVLLPAEVVVWPAPRPGRRERTAEAEGAEQEDGPHSGPWGDFAGLRPYRPGDRPRSIHWPTSARVAEVHVAIRHDAAGECTWVRVPDRRGRAWEDALAAACGEVVRAFRSGHSVGLDLAGEVMEPRPGAPWRRVLLDTLGRAPRRAP